MMKRLPVILLFLSFLLTGSAQSLNSVQIDDSSCVNFDSCYLKFPAEHNKFEALYRKTVEGIQAYENS